MIFQNSCAPAFRITWLSPLGSIEDFPKTAKVRCEGPHPRCDALSRRGLTPIKLAYDWRRPAALTALTDYVATGEYASSTGHTGYSYAW